MNIVFITTTYQPANCSPNLKTAYQTCKLLTKQKDLWYKCNKIVSGLHFDPSRVFLKG